MPDTPDRPAVFPRITSRRDQMGGVPCIRGLRMPVATIVGRIASGDTAADLFEDFPYLQPDDIRQAMHYAAEVALGTAVSTTPELGPSA